MMVVMMMMTFFPSLLNVAGMEGLQVGMEQVGIRQRTEHPNCTE